MHPLHREHRLIERIGWLRAAVLGANDGIISTASPVVGVAAASNASCQDSGSPPRKIASVITSAWGETTNAGFTSPPSA